MTAYHIFRKTIRRHQEDRAPITFDDYVKLHEAYQREQAEMYDAITKTKNDLHEVMNRIYMMMPVTCPHCGERHKQSAIGCPACEFDPRN